MTLRHIGLISILLISSAFATTASGSEIEEDFVTIEPPGRLTPATVYLPVVLSGSQDPVLAYRQALVALVNQERLKQGLAPLRLEQRLTQAATGHSWDMALNNFVGHVGSDGSEPPDRLERVGYPVGPWGETVAAGQPDPRAVLEAWKTSPPHWAILMGSYAEIGIGYAFSVESTFYHFWTVDVSVPSP